MIGSQPRLTVAVSMIGARIESWTLDRLPKTPGIVYLILAQSTSTEQRQIASDQFARGDISIVFLDSIGVSNSRNAALDRVQSEFLLFADDDIVLLNDAYPRLIKYFEDQPELDFLVGRLRSEAHALHKNYPPAGTPVRRTNSGRVGTPELAIRVDRFRQLSLYFDVAFGAGTEQPFGEEYIFICDALSKNLKGAFVDVDLAVHTGKSTGQRMRVGTAPLRQAVLSRALGKTSWPYRVGYAIKHRKIFSDLRELCHFLRP